MNSFISTKTFVVKSFVFEYLLFLSKKTGMTIFHLKEISNEQRDKKGSEIPLAGTQSIMALQVAGHPAC
jgi:hypothetical protein